MALARLDAAFTAHYLDGFHEWDFPDFSTLHWVGQTWFFDLQASYEFGTTSPSKLGERFHYGWGTWRNLLERRKITVGGNNLFDHDRPGLMTTSRASFTILAADSFTPA